MVETRNQEGVKKMDVRMQNVEQRLQNVDELQETVLGFHDELQNMGRTFRQDLQVLTQEMRNLTHGNSNRNGQPRNNGDTEDRRRPRGPRMEFPRYDGKNIHSWILKCERYFRLENVLEELKVDTAAVNLDSDSFEWQLAVERRWGDNRPTWPEYAELLRKTFGPPYEKPMTELTHLRQEGALSEFNVRFDTIAARLDLSEAYLVDVYVGALKQEIADAVLMFDPRTLVEARRLARVQEIAMGHRVNKSERTGKQVVGPPTSVAREGSYKNALLSGGVSQQNQVTPLLIKDAGASSSKNSARYGKPFKMLTAEEEAEHRAKNLCFFCHEPFSRDHRCAQRQKMQLHFIVVDGEDEEFGCHDEDRSDDAVPLISLHAINGDDTGRTMKIGASIGTRNIYVLIDNGSTHDFLDVGLARRLGWKEHSTDLSTVQVAGGGQLKVYGVWEGFKWRMQGLEFECSLRIIDLNTYDIVLGLQWLKSIKNAYWEYDKMVMHFWYKGKLCKLQATGPKALDVRPVTRLHGCWGGDQRMFLVQLLRPSNQCQCFVMQTEDEAGFGEVQLALKAFEDVFSEPKELPPLRRGHNHSIVLREGTNPINLKPYRYSAEQKDVIEQQIKELLQHGVLQESSSPFSAPIVLVKKKDGTWRMCIDYRELNKCTIKNQYPIPLVEDLLDELHLAKWFTKLDLRAGYHQIRMVPEDCFKTAFKTHSGHYEWLVMPFGLTNAPATFQGAMNDIFRPFLRKFVLVFFDDILIYSPSIEEHVHHLETVLGILRNQQYFVKKSKCTFAAQNVEYLGHIIADGKVATDPRKIQAVVEWPEPKNVKQLRGFLGLAGYYRRFIKGFGEIARPLTLLTRKDAFCWTEQASCSFKKLKDILVSAPVLALPDFSKGFVVETDACGAGVGAVLMQEGQPLAFFSKALAPQHVKLSIYEKELLAVVLAVENWHQYLERGRFSIRTDQQSLKFLLGQKLKTPFQMYWIAKLMGYDYEIQYKRGSDNSVADSLSRLHGSQILQISLDTGSPELLELIKGSWEIDSGVAALLADIKQQEDGVLRKFVWDGSILRKDGKIVVGNVATTKQKVLEWLHSSAQGGHSGINATYQKIRSLFWWKNLHKEVEEFVKGCDTCARCKYETIASPGLLQPLPVPSKVWESISMDFIEGLPKSNGKEVIWVIIDRMSKYAHFLSLAHPFSASSLAQIFLGQVYKLHGAPVEIISDRDPIFVSNFWKEFVRILRIEQKLSSAYHPQSDGQTEVLNRCLESYLRCMCWENPKEWDQWIPLAEWWYNTTFHTSIQTTPYELLYGQKPPIYSPYIPRSAIIEAVDRSFEARERMLAVLKYHLHKAVNTMKQRADLKRSDREFQLGQWVFLKLQPYRQVTAATRSTQKLAPRFYGPYKVIERVGPVAYRLELPLECRIHPIFHVSLLKLCPDPMVKQRHPPIDFPSVPSSQYPEKILATRVGRKKKRIITEVLVQWRGYPEEEASWTTLYGLQQQYPEFSVSNP